MALRLELNDRHFSHLPKYSYKRRRRDDRMYPKFRQLFINWTNWPVGETRIIPRTHNKMSDFELNHVRHHVKKYAIERGFWPGSHYGIQKDVKNQCMVITKLDDIPGLPEELI